MKQTQKLSFFCALLLLITAIPTAAQMTPQNPSPSTETTRPHPRTVQRDTPGERFELKSLKSAILFVPEKLRTRIKSGSIPLVIHFHGAAWLVQQQISEESKAALITINLGSGSRAYGGPFSADSQLFRKILDEASQFLKLTKSWKSITLVGFSAGYGGIRAILRQPENFKLVNNVLLLDGFHASYVPEGKPLEAAVSFDTRTLIHISNSPTKLLRGAKTSSSLTRNSFPAPMPAQPNALIIC